MSSPPSASNKATLYTFNKYFAEYVMFLKKLHPDVKAALENYRVMENLSTLRDNIEHFSTKVTISEHTMTLLRGAVKRDDDDDIIRSIDLEELEPVKGVTFGKIRTCLLEDSDSSRSSSAIASLWVTLGYVYILAIVHEIYDGQIREGETDATSCSERDEAHSDRLKCVLNAIGKIRIASDHAEEEATSVDVRCILEGEDIQILDDEFIALFDGLRLCDVNAERERKKAAADKGEPSDEDPPSGEQQKNPDDFMKMFEDSKIGALAREMMSDLDIAKMTEEAASKGKSPMDMFDLSTLLDPQSGTGGMLVKMAHKMQNKMNSGEMRMEELFGEVMGMVNGNDMMKNNPLVNTLLNSLHQKQAQNGGQNTTTGEERGGGTTEGTGGMGGMLGAMMSKMGGGAGNESDDTDNLDDLMSKLGKLQTQCSEASSSSRSTSSATSRRMGNSDTNRSSTHDRLRKIIETRRRQQQHQK